MRLIKKASSNVVKIVMIFVMTMGLFATNTYAVPLAEEPVTLYVSVNGGSNNTARAEGATYTSLSAAIDKAINGDTIKLLNDTVSVANWYGNTFLDKLLS